MSSIFITLPTSDLSRAKHFYTAIGWTINPVFTDENAICVVIDEHATLMVLKRDFFATFVEGKTVGDPATTSLASIAFDLPSREAVDAFVDRVRQAGGHVYDPSDYGFMYQVGFDDPDGNHFEPLWMDPVAAAQGPAAVSEPTAE